MHLKHMSLFGVGCAVVFQLCYHIIPFQTKYVPPNIVNNSKNKFFEIILS
jgi:hypothetical protein